MKIYYWCPFLSHVATIRAVLNSAYSIKKYSKNSISPYIINAVGEWNTYSDFISINKIGLVNFSNSDNFYKSLPRYGYLKSRIAYGMIFFKTFKKLFKFLKSLKENDNGMIYLKSCFDELGIKYLNSYTNFLTIYLGSKTKQIFNDLLHQGVILRPLNNYGLSKYLRVTIGTDSENRYFIKKLKKTLKMAK